MSAMTIDIPDCILEARHYNLEQVKTDIQRGLVIWECLNGQLSLRECGDILRIGYRGFLELLWSKGIPVDGLSNGELAQQVDALRKTLVDSSSKVFNK